MFADQFSQEQQDNFIETVKKSKLILKSDAHFLPRSTNKGQIPIPIAQPKAKQGSRTNQLSPSSYEENAPEANLCELQARRRRMRLISSICPISHSHSSLWPSLLAPPSTIAPTTESKSMSPKKPAFKRVIPCLYVSSIQAALPFYKHMLGFTPVSKPDTMKAHLKSKGGDQGEEGIEIYLRTPPLGSDGTRSPLAPTSLWIAVEKVDGE